MPEHKVPGTGGGAGAGAGAGGIETSWFRYEVKILI